MGHSIQYPNPRSRVHCDRSVRLVENLYDYAECGLERFRLSPKARDRWLMLLWWDFDGIHKAVRSSGWKDHRARKQWEHNVVLRARHRANRARKTLRRGEWPFE